MKYGLPLLFISCEIRSVNNVLYEVLKFKKSNSLISESGYDQSQLENLYYNSIRIFKFINLIYQLKFVNLKRKCGLAHDMGN